MRAWRGAAGLREQGSARSWLYTIATNVCLTELERRKRRVLPHDFGPAAEGLTPPGRAGRRVDVDRAVSRRRARRARGAGDAGSELRAARGGRAGVRRRCAAPRRQSARRPDAPRGARLQRQGDRHDAGHVGPVGQQRAAAGPRLDPGAGPRTQPAGDPAQRSATAACAGSSIATSTPGSAATWPRSPRCSSQDATFAMPPLATWYAPRDTIATWAANFAMSGAWRWRGVLTQANAQPALAFYAWDDSAGAYLPFALNVLSLRGDLISDVTAFIVRSIDASEPEAYVRFPSSRWTSASWRSRSNASGSRRA